MRCTSRIFFLIVDTQVISVLAVTWSNSHPLSVRARLYDLVNHHPISWSLEASSRNFGSRVRLHLLVKSHHNSLCSVHYWSIYISCIRPFIWSKNVAFGTWRHFGSSAWILSGIWVALRTCLFTTIFSLCARNSFCSTPVDLSPLSVWTRFTKRWKLQTSQERNWF